MDVQLSAGDRETLPDCAKGLRSESGYDELEFYPDDVRQHSISGEIICRPGPLSGRIAT